MGKDFHWGVNFIEADEFLAGPPIIAPLPDV